jgi:hypothetical protein
MRLVASLFISFFLLTGCADKKRGIDQFTPKEVDEISYRIGVALTQGKPELLSSLIGMSQVMDSSISLAISNGLSEYQINRLGLDNPRNYNDGLKETLKWICYYSSMDGNVVLSSKKLTKEKISLTYTYSNPANFFEILDFELITNGYQLFVGDIKIVHRDTRLSEWIMTNILSPGYAENISEMTKALEKAYNEATKENWDRAEYFFKSVPYEYLIDPMILEHSIPVTYMFDTLLNKQVFHDAILGIEDDRAKVYWKVRRELFFKRTDSIEFYIKGIESLIGQNKITQVLISNEPNY